MEDKKIAEINEDTSKKGIVYITDNENMFIAAENISNEEFDRLALETDIDAMKEKLGKMEAKLLEMKNLQHSQEIKRDSPFEQQEHPQNEDYLFKYKTGNFKNIVIFDTETTGRNPGKDEILQFSAVDINGQELLNRYIKPEHHKEWPDAMKKNHITPEMVESSPVFPEVKSEIQKLLDNADLFITYNGKFDMDFLQKQGIRINPAIPHLDVMKAWTDDYKKHSSVPLDKPYLNLEESAAMINFNHNAHNSLDDSKATLKLAQNLYGQKLEKLTPELIDKFTVNKALPSGLDRKNPDYWKMIKKIGAEAFENDDLMKSILENPKNKKLISLTNSYLQNPDVKQNKNRLINELGRHIVNENPEITEKYFKNKEYQKENKKLQMEDSYDSVFSGTETLPSFTLMTKNGIKSFENMKFKGFLEKEGMYLLDNGKEQLKIPVTTFETVLNPGKAQPYFQNNDKTETAEENPAIITGKTIIPEFAMITGKGLETFRDLVVEKFNASENSYKLSNGKSSLIVTGETFRELISPDRFDRQYAENEPQYKKLIQSQYDDYFMQRENTAGNFRHNLSVYSRKEANTPLDALQIAKELITRMSKEEKIKTRQLLKQMKKEDETINQFIIRTYFNAIKEVPLNQDKILQKPEESRIAKPFNDTITTTGQLLDKNSTLKIGDTVKDLAFNTEKLFGIGKEKLFEDLTVISSSKESNIVLLMDKNRSFYEVPRDSLLEGYNRQQEKQYKAEQKQKKSRRIDIGWER